MARRRRLELQDGIIAGECGGIVVRFDVSPFIIRLIFFILLLPGGLPGLLPCPIDAATVARAPLY